MKPYPFKEVTIPVGGFAGDSGETRKIVIPTPEAINNFEHYLDEAEYVFYWQLTDDTRVHLALSRNPFSEFQDIYKNSAS